MGATKHAELPADPSMTSGIESLLSAYIAQYFCGEGYISAPQAVIVTMSPLLTDIFRELFSRKVAIEIVAEIDRHDPLDEQLRALQPDLVLIGLRNGEADAIARSVVLTLPHAKVIAFSSDARHVYVYQMRPHRAELHDVSRDALLAILKV